MAEPINPVTFSGRSASGEEIKLSIGRLHVGRGEVSDGMHRKRDVQKNVTCVVWKQDGDEIKSITEMVIDEDHLVRGLRHLFCNGELND